MQGNLIFAIESHWSITNEYSLLHSGYLTHYPNMLHESSKDEQTNESFKMKHPIPSL